MIYNLPLQTLFLYVINLTMIIALSYLSTRISEINNDSELDKVYKQEFRGVLYLVNVVLIGINIFSLFICNDIIEYSLHRLLTPYGFRTKLRVVSEF